MATSWLARKPMRSEGSEANAAMARKYGEGYFTEGTSRLAQTRVCSRLAAHPDPIPSLTLARRSQAEKLQKLNEIRAQLQETSTSVRQGKQLLGSLAENYGSTPSLQ